MNPSGRESPSSSEESEVTMSQIRDLFRQLRRIEEGRSPISTPSNESMSSSEFFRSSIHSSFESEVASQQSGGELNRSREAPNAVHSSSSFTHESEMTNMQRSQLIDLQHAIEHASPEVAVRAIASILIEEDEGVPDQILNETEEAESILVGEEEIEVRKGDDDAGSESGSVVHSDDSSMLSYLPIERFNEANKLFEQNKFEQAREKYLSFLIHSPLTNEHEFSKINSLNLFLSEERLQGQEQELRTYVNYRLAEYLHQHGRNYLALAHANIAHGNTLDSAQLVMIYSLRAKIYRKLDMEGDAESDIRAIFVVIKTIQYSVRTSPVQPLSDSLEYSAVSELEGILAEEFAPEAGVSSEIQALRSAVEQGNQGMLAAQDEVAQLKLKLEHETRERIAAQNEVKNLRREVETVKKNATEEIARVQALLAAANKTLADHLARQELRAQADRRGSGASSSSSAPNPRGGRH